MLSFQNGGILAIRERRKKKKKEREREKERVRGMEGRKLLLLW